MKKNQKTVLLHGRPKRAPEDLRGTILSIRVSETELVVLQQKAAVMYLPIGAYMRQAALLRQLPPPPAPELNRKAYAELGRIGGNIHQISRRLNFGDTLTEQGLKELLSLLREIRFVLLGIKDDCQSG